MKSILKSASTQFFRNVEKKAGSALARSIASIESVLLNEISIVWPSNLIYKAINGNPSSTICARAANATIAKMVYSDLNVLSIPLVLFMVLSLELSVWLCCLRSHLSRTTTYHHDVSLNGILRSSTNPIDKYEHFANI